jgi:hypothetical protein
VRTAIGLIVLLCVIAFIAVVLWRRRGRDEIHSIDSYRNALDTLQEMRGAPGSASIRVLAPDEQQSLRQPPPQAAITTGMAEPPPTAVPPPPDAIDGMVFADDIGELGRSAPAPESPSGKGHEDPTWAIGRMESRPRFQSRQIIVGAVAALVIVALVIIGTLIGSTHSATTSTTSKGPHHVTTTVKHGPKKKPSPTTTTPPTVPKSYAPQNATATSATYNVASGTYTVVITANSGACWTVATDGNGNQVFAGSVSPGTPQSLKATGTLVINLGAPANVSVSIGGVPVTFPAGYQTPLVLTFQPAPPTTTTVPSAPSTPSTTTTSLPVTTTSGITP